MKKPKISEEDELILTNLFHDLRGQANVYKASARDLKNKDTAAVMIGSADHMLKRARALHRALEELGIYLGEHDY